MAREECPRRAGWQYLDVEDGYAPLAYLPKCGSASCPVCIRTEVWKWGRMIGTASPSRYGVFTGLHDDWQANRNAFRVLFQRLDRNGYQLRAFYNVEHNPKETGYHANVWWWGPDVPHDLAVECAVSVGWKPRVSLNRWQSRADDRYGLKEVVYGLKETRDAGATGSTRVQGGAARYLLNNGGRLMHARSGRNSPYRLGVGGEVYSNRRDFWAAMGAAEGRQAQEAREVLTCRDDLQIVGSRDLPAATPPAWATPLETTGRWAPAAPGRSDWSWGPVPSGPSPDDWTLWQEESA